MIFLITDRNVKQYICFVEFINAVHLQELERRLALQEQDSVIVKNMKSEVARLPEMEREIKRLREENAFLRYRDVPFSDRCGIDNYWK